MNKMLDVSIACVRKAIGKIFICCLILLLGVATAVASPSPAFAISPGGYVDMVFVVDESGSMSGEHEWLKDAVVTLEAELKSADIGTGTQPNRYGLVGFGMGGSNDPPESYQVGNGLFGSSSELVRALDKLSLTGNFEDGYAGIDEALNHPFRRSASVNIVLVTDEDRDISDSSLTYSRILSKLAAKDAVLNVVLNTKLEDGSGRTALGIDSEENAYIPNGNGGFITTTGGKVIAGGAATTKTDYADLALETKSGAAGGAVWDLNQLRNIGLLADSFSSAFSKVKVEEVSDSIIILDKNPGTFEVCANNERGTRVITRVGAGDSDFAVTGGDYFFDVLGGQLWYSGESFSPDQPIDGIYTYEGNPNYREPSLSNPNLDGFSLIAVESNLGLEYQISKNHELPIYFKDLFFFKMNDNKGQYGNNFNCLSVDYEYRGELN